MCHAVLTQQKVLAWHAPCLRLRLTLKPNTRRSIEHRDRNCLFSHKSLGDSTSNNSTMSSDQRAGLKQAVTAAGQGHLLDDWDRLSTDQRLQLTADIQVLSTCPPDSTSIRHSSLGIVVQRRLCCPQEFDLAYVNKSYSASKSVAGIVVSSQARCHKSQNNQASVKRLLDCS